MSSQALQWQCISQCGACCRLAPEERPEALDDEERATYPPVVGHDGGCSLFVNGCRRCRIHHERPRFCRVRNMDQLFGVEPDQLDAFAIGCCQQQIRSVYGGRSRELRRFNRAQRRPDG